jgi:hypothetical protein
MNTIWGEAQTIDRVCDGIVFVTTAGHGGYILTNRMLTRMPAYLRACSFTKDGNFEEDCSWCAVVLAFPQSASVLGCTAERAQEIALATLKNYYPDAYAEHVKNQKA